MEIKLLITFLIGFLIVAIAANAIAKAFQKVKFPLITGLIITGIIAGSSVLNFISSEALDKLNFLNEIARKQNKGIIITSHVYSDFDNKDKVKMVGGDFLKYSSKCLIELENLNNNLRKATIIRHRSIKESKEFYFEIKEKEITEEPTFDTIAPNTDFTNEAPF